MSKSAILRARVDSRRKRAAEAVFTRLGLSAGEAVNLFLAQVELRQGLPFSVTLRPPLDLSNATLAEIEARYADRRPNQASREAWREDTRQAKRHRSAADLRAALQS